MSDVLAVVDHRQGALRDVSFELLSAGRDLADATGGDLFVAVVNGPTAAFADEVDREGVDAIYTVDAGEEFDHDVYAGAAVHLVETLEPRILLAPNSVNGIDYLPAVATRLDWPLVTDAVGLELEGETLVATREHYGGKVEATLEVALDGGVAVTIRAGEWPAATGEGAASVEDVAFDLEESANRSRVLGFEAVAGGDVDIAEADVLVSVGRGIEDEENLELIEELAEALGATVSASRPVVDAGWLPKNRQVGQSGKVVTPDVYIAIGISGAVQHVAGMKGAKTIVAINTDPNAPIMDIADYAIHDDLFDVVPALIEQFE
ncbi:electron transfer flavoprotein subunit alpha/FixB family protein [Natronobiforma cellulositropha]|uniref:electron transfer flavoprotein subunit alpha/FixB family protein n=1 Tax=Natronobiforma cellulositropha TaxID=1679076 RepID=UPI0021D5822B|nr:electron transfer flavoprotein subunit alpha/FixB family protein [Natronobiforma cellulositropha]